METIIDDNGHINIPKALLDKANLNVGSKVRLIEKNGSLVIMPIRDASYFLKVIERFDHHDLPTKEEMMAWKKEDIDLEDR
jgi:bifunctional DNA-binding transcriptional regulator/antitoxin component of YhaV-PrlF toxin-antitoxin module